MQCDGYTISMVGETGLAFASSNGQFGGQTFSRVTFFRQMQGDAQGANTAHSKTRVSRHRPQSHSLHQVTAVDTAGL